MGSAQLRQALRRPRAEYTLLWDHLLNPKPDVADDGKVLAWRAVPDGLSASRPTALLVSSDC